MQERAMGDVGACVAGDRPVAVGEGVRAGRETDAKRVSREERRARMPVVSAFVDELAAQFGPVTVIHAQEGGLTWGKPDEPKCAVKVSEMAFWQDAQAAKTRGRRR